jgi:hypothetical protein
MELEKETQRKDWYKKIGFGEYDINTTKFKTKVHEKFLRDEDERKMMEAHHKIERKENFSKANKYAKFVKEMHWPKISKIKKQEMANINHSHEYKRSLNQSDNSAVLKRRISTNRSEMRTLDKKNSYISGTEPTFSGLNNVKRSGNHSYSILKRSKNKYKKNNMIPKPQPKKEPVIVDYLFDKRMDRHRLESKGNKRKYKNLYSSIENPTTDRQHNLSGNNVKFFYSRNGNNYSQQNNTIDPNDQNLSRIDHIDRIRDKSRQLEEIVDRKEQLMKYQGGTIKETQNVNEMLFDAISAKLKILEVL